jgi:quercetin dioxygenase-like cupin family protein
VNKMGATDAVQWSADSPLRLDYFLSRNTAESWRDGTRSYFEYRDLGLGAASGGVMGAIHGRVKSGSTDRASGWHFHDNEFQFFYVLAGSLTLEVPSGETFTLNKGDIGWQPGGWVHREYDFSDDYQFVEFTSPAGPKTIKADANTQSVSGGLYEFDAPAAHVADNRLRSFFTYRDVVPADRVGGRMLIQEMRVIDTPEGGTGWHYHTMSQLFFVTGGWVEIKVEGQGTMILNAMDAMCIAAGLKHDVSGFSEDYSLLELCAPANYETISVESPPGF